MKTNNFSGQTKSTEFLIGIVILISLINVSFAWKIRTTKKVFGLNQPIVVEFQNLPGNQNDWITIVRAYSPADTQGQYATTIGQRQGKMWFLPEKIGVYQARLYYDWPNGEYMLHQQFEFAVSNCAQGCLRCDKNYCHETLPSYYLNDQKTAVQCHHLCGNCVTAGSNQCTSCEAGQVLKPDGTCFAPGKGVLLLDGSNVFAAYQRIVIHWVGFSGSKMDWITIVDDVNKKEDDEGVYKEFLNGYRDGQLIVQEGLKPGQYEARGYYDYPNGGFKVQARLKFTVTCAVGCNKCSKETCSVPLSGYFVNLNGQPQTCHVSCKTCDGGNTESNCRSCYSDFLLKEGICHDPALEPFVQTEKKNYQAFEPITVEYKNINVSKEDWIALALRGSRDSEFRSWRRVSFQTGIITFQDGLPPGAYEAQIHRDWPEGSFTVFSRYPFDVACYRNCARCNGQQCVEPQAGYFLDVVTKNLEKCDKTCQTCQRAGPTGCSSCPEGRIYVNRKTCELDSNSQLVQVKEKSKSKGVKIQKTKTQQKGRKNGKNSSQKKVLLKLKKNN